VYRNRRQIHQIIRYRTPGFDSCQPAIKRSLVNISINVECHCDAFITGPIIRRLVDAYGPERSIYGGGFNCQATGASYRAYRERVAGYLANLSKKDLALVLGGTASKVFGFA